MLHLFSKGREPAPWLYVKARLCQRWHCLPSQLAGENAHELMQMSTMLAVGDNYKAGEEIDWGDGSNEEEDDAES